MQVALTDKRSNAAIVTVISHLRKTPTANKLATMQSIVQRGARVGAMRRVAVALSSISQRSHTRVTQKLPMLDAACSTWRRTRLLTGTRASRLSWLWASAASTTHVSARSH